MLFGSAPESLLHTWELTVPTPVLAPPGVAAEGMRAFAARNEAARCIWATDMQDGVFGVLRLCYFDLAERCRAGGGW